jgi:hypothetical protein
MGHLVERTSWYRQLQEAADEFKRGMEDCNAAGRALAIATDDHERLTASRLHEEKYRTLTALKRRLIEIAGLAPR